MQLFAQRPPSCNMLPQENIFKHRRQERLSNLVANHLQSTDSIADIVKRIKISIKCILSGTRLIALHNEYIVQYLFEHIFPPAPTTRRKSYFCVSKTIKFSILCKICLCILYRDSVSDTEQSCWKCLKIPHTSVSDTEQFCTPSNWLNNVCIVHWDIWERLHSG